MKDPRFNLVQIHFISRNKEILVYSIPISFASRVFYGLFERVLFSSCTDIPISIYWDIKYFSSETRKQWRFCRTNLKLSQSKAMKSILRALLRSIRWESKNEFIGYKSEEKYPVVYEMYNSCWYQFNLKTSKQLLKFIAFLMKNYKLNIKTAYDIYLQALKTKEVRLSLEKLKLDKKVLAKLYSVSEYEIETLFLKEGLTYSWLEQESVLLHK